MAFGFTSADPAFTSTQPNIWVVHQLFNGLVALDDSLRIIPSISKRWNISENGLEYTFHIRDSVFFHDDACFPGGNGRKVTASDFVYSFTRIIDGATASPGAWVF
nr:ABC transporter substrate-binding protein [Bacteroidota bacterium]